MLEKFGECKPVDKDGSRACEGRASNGGDERQADLLNGKAVDALQHDRDGDEEGEDDREVEAKVERGEHDDWFAEEHGKGGKDGDLKHAAESDSAASGHQFGGRQIVLLVLAFQYLARVCFGHADAEEKYCEGEHQRHPLRPTPASWCEDEATNEGPCIVQSYVQQS